MGGVGLIASATIAVAAFFSPVDAEELNLNGSIYSFPSAYYITMNNVETDASSTINIRFPNIILLAKQYERQYDERDIEFGMPVNLDFLKVLRNIESYEKEFINFTNELSFKGKLFLAYELSQLQYDTVFGCEEEYILSLMNSGNLEMQEVALNAVVNWGNSNLVQKLNNLKISNVFLQQELDELLKEIV